MSPSRLAEAKRIRLISHDDDDYIQKLSDRLLSGGTVPPVLIVTDHQTTWICDGYMRMQACIRAKCKVPVLARSGNRADAIRLAIQMQSSYDRSNEDKRIAVACALKSFPDDTNREIAELCGVSHTFVNKLVDASPVRRTLSKSGPKANILPIGKPQKPVRRRNGMPKVNAKAKAEAVKSLGSLIRSMQRLNIYEQHHIVLSQLTEGIEAL